MRWSFCILFAPLGSIQWANIVWSNALLFGYFRDYVLIGGRVIFVTNSKHGSISWRPLFTILISCIAVDVLFLAVWSEALQCYFHAWTMIDAACRASVLEPPIFVLKDEAVRGVLLHLLHIRIIVALKKTSQCLANLLALNFSIQLQTTDWWCNDKDSYDILANGLSLG